MTIQQICDRLELEANGFPSDPHPFRPDSIDDAVRGIPDDMDWRLSTIDGGWSCDIWPDFQSGLCWSGDSTDLPSHAVYFANAKARGWM